MLLFNPIEVIIFYYLDLCFIVSLISRSQWQTKTHNHRNQYFKNTKKGTILNSDTAWSKFGTFSWMDKGRPQNLWIKSTNWCYSRIPFRKLHALKCLLIDTSISLSTFKEWKDSWYGMCSRRKNYPHCLSYEKFRSNCS